jgi:hypothetical protein
VARGISFALLILVAVSACVGDDPPTPSTTTTPVDGGSSGGPADTGLVENGSFENGCGEPLFSSNGAITPDSTTAKTGGKSCKLCRTPGGEPSLYFYARLDVQPKVGEVYEVSAWMRKAPGIESGGDGEIAIGGLDVNGSQNGDSGSGAGLSAITDTWKEAKATWTVARDDGVKVRVVVGLPAAADNVCFLVDDLSVKKTK